MINFESLDLPRIPVIYCIENIISGKIYIGSTQDYRERLQYQHFWALRRNEHYNDHLQNSYNKYSEDAFIIFILEQCEVKDLIVREQHYLDTLLFAQEYIKSNGKDKRFKKLGLNLSPTAGGHSGYKATPQQIERNRQKMKKLWQDPQYKSIQKKIRTPEWHEKRLEKVLQAKQKDPTYRQRMSAAAKIFAQKYKKPILLYNRHTGQFFKKFDGLIDCIIELGIQGQRLRACLQSRRRYTGDYVIKLHTDDNYPLQITPVAQYTSKERRAQGMAKVHAKNSVAILAFKLNDELIGEYVSAVDAAHKLGLGKHNVSGIRMVLYGKCEQCKGYKFKYKDPNYKPRKYNKRVVV